MWFPVIISSDLEIHEVNHKIGQTSSIDCDETDEEKSAFTLK